MRHHEDFPEINQTCQLIHIGTWRTYIVDMICHAHPSLTNTTYKSFHVILKDGPTAKYVVLPPNESSLMLQGPYWQGVQNSTRTNSNFDQWATDQLGQTD